MEGMDPLISFLGTIVPPVGPLLRASIIFIPSAFKFIRNCTIYPVSNQMLIGAPPMSEPFVDLLRSGINLLASDKHGNVEYADEISKIEINGALPVDDLGPNLSNLNNSTHPYPRRCRREDEEVAISLAYFLGPQGDALYVEGWWESRIDDTLDVSTSDGPIFRLLPCFRITTEVVVPRRATVLLLRHRLGIGLNIDIDEQSKISTDARNNYDLNALCMANLAAQIQIIKFGYSGTFPPTSKQKSSRSIRDTQKFVNFDQDNIDADNLFLNFERLTKSCLMPILKDVTEMYSFRKYKQDKSGNKFVSSGNNNSNNNNNNNCKLCVTDGN